MSVYSGFATRQQEKKYNQCVASTLSFLVKRISKFYAGEPCDEYKFKHFIKSLYERMAYLEQAKYSPPHYSYILQGFLNQMETIFGEFSKLKQDDPFKDNELSMSLASKKIKFNTAGQYQERDVSFSNQINQEEKRQSQNTFQNTLQNFKKRAKTLTPDHSLHYAPQKVSPFRSKKQSPLESDERNIFKMEERPKRPIIKDIIQAPKLVNGNKNNQKALSPRQYLRQTIMGKQTPNHLSIRTKQKHQKIMNF